MQSLNKYNKGIKYLLCENDLFSKYAWIAYKGFLKINNIEMYSIYNKVNSVVPERFIRTMKNKLAF